MNEGNFQWGNASIHRYDPKSKSYDDQDLFSRVNQRPLGDVLQSGLVLENEIWMVVNNSGRIEVVNKSDFKLVKSFTDFLSPRYLCEIDPDRMLVSDLYLDSLTLFNRHTGKVLQRIALKGWSEQM
ncbi:MAG: YncE family protein, partial [Bacteroidota bacterium]|nr:YncE family protein [Bacteroidota bacterium]MDX5430553.1 YncE family protein [Bacteroidota bacterium]MDX5469305.1 YncE family protein [Bacteroidota bacterium]